MRFVIVADAESEASQERTIAAVSGVLEEFGEVGTLYYNPYFINELAAGDVVFNLAGGMRKGFLQGSVSAMIESAGFDLIGSPAYTHYVCLDKLTTKGVLGGYGLSTPDGVVYDGNAFVGEFPEPPLIVKPIMEGYGFGIEKDSLCNTVDEAKKIAVERYAEFGESILVEKYLRGKEMTVGVLGHGEDIEVLPPLEIDFSDLPDGIERFYSHTVKYDYAEKTVYRCPMPLEPEELREIEEMAVKCFRAVRASDYLRIDMRFHEGRPCIIEVNSMPGLDPATGDIPKMPPALSKDYEWLVKRIFKRVLPPGR